MSTTKQLKVWYPLRVNEFLDHQKTSEVLDDQTYGGNVTIAQKEASFNSELEQVKVEIESIESYII